MESLLEEIPDSDGLVGVLLLVSRTKLPRKPSAKVVDLNAVSTSRRIQAEVDRLDVLVDVFADRLLLRMADRLRAAVEISAPDAASTDLPADALVDQDNGRIPRELFLRLAREGAFPSWKEGDKAKRIYAFWGDVKVALGARMAQRGPVEPPGSVETDDGLCRQLGILPKGRG